MKNMHPYGLDAALQVYQATSSPAPSIFIKHEDAESLFSRSSGIVWMLGSDSQMQHSVPHAMPVEDQALAKLVHVAALFSFGKMQPEYLANGERIEGVGGLREVLRSFPCRKHGPII